MQDHTAGPQTLGYFYQARYALYLILNAQPEAELSIEKVDDVAFEQEGSLRELLQLKHHVNRKASLTDASTDLWKTIRVWSENVNSGVISASGLLLTIITTATAPDDSIAALLRPGEQRDTQTAGEKLLAVTRESSNRELEKAFEAFTALTPQQRADLLKSIQVLDSSPNIIDTVSEIKNRTRYAVLPEHLDRLYERLEGWWFNKVIDHLIGSSIEPIVGMDVHFKIRDIADQFKPDALPIDFYDKFPPTQPDPETDDRVFVHQLKIIALHNKRIKNAILDYYRAFEQRSRWVREELLFDEELSQYERKLVDEWERYFLALQDRFSADNASEADLQKFGREIYDWMEIESNIRIRPEVDEPYVQRGSYQMLADELRVGWHPNFVERLRELLGGE
jgi:hypothetical protein